MKKIMVAVLAVVLGAFASASVAGSYYELSLLSLKAETDRLGKLGVTFPSPGNAAGIYVPYLKGEAQITKQEWFKKIYYSTLKEEKDGDRELLEKGVRLADKDIEALVKASSMAECKVWGEYFKPDPSVKYFVQETPGFRNLEGLCTLIIAKGKQLGSAGYPDAAVEHYLAALRMGHHMEKDSHTFYYIIGIVMKERAATALADHYRARGMNDAARKWALYHDISEMRRMAFRTFGMLHFEWGEAAAREFVMDPDMPYSFKIEVLAYRKNCAAAMGNKISLYYCVYLGPPDWVDELLDEFGKQDNLSAQFVEQIRAEEVTMDDFMYAEAFE